MRIHYTGGRTHYEVNFNRRALYFSKENNYILEINDKQIVNYIFSLPNRQDFEVVMDSLDKNVTYITSTPENNDSKKPLFKKPSRPKKEK